MPGLWIADLRVSDRTRRKLAQRHGVDADDLRARLVGVTGLVYAWDFHPERGRRVIVEVRQHGRRLLVVLYPVGDREEVAWHLGSAYPISGARRRRRRRLER